MSDIKVETGKLPRHWFKDISPNTKMDTNTNNQIIEVSNAKKYIVLPDGRMARLLKPVKVKKYEYYSFINDQGKAVRINASNSRNINAVVESK
jgi:ABC-type uncharacterized transport system substrate-binding protein